MPHVPPPHPARTVGVERHVVPQVPQAALSVDRSWHAPPQFVSGNVQVTAHVPWSHTCPVPQACPHAPQVPGAPRSASQPLVGSPSQSAKPGPHAVTVQAPPAEHATAVTSGPSGHGSQEVAEAQPYAVESSGTHWYAQNFVPDEHTVGQTRGALPSTAPSPTPPPASPVAESCAAFSSPPSLLAESAGESSPIGPVPSTDASGAPSGPPGASPVVASGPTPLSVAEPASSPDPFVLLQAPAQRRATSAAPPNSAFPCPRCMDLPIERNGTRSWLQSSLDAFVLVRNRRQPRRATMEELPKAGAGRAWLRASSTRAPGDSSRRDRAGQRFAEWPSRAGTDLARIASQPGSFT
jgi:hypothetical protein